MNLPTFKLGEQRIRSDRNKAEIFQLISPAHRLYYQWTECIYTDWLCPVIMMSLLADRHDIIDTQRRGGNNHDSSSSSPPSSSPTSSLPSSSSPFCFYSPFLHFSSLKNPPYFIVVLSDLNLRVIEMLRSI